MGASILEYESGQTAVPFGLAAAGPENTKFQASFAPISLAAGATPVVAPMGLKTGGGITPTATNDEIAIAASTVVAPGVSGADANGVVAVSAGTVTIQRGASSNTHRVTSITVNGSGNYVAVAGTAGTSFSTTRGDNGAPPLIPVDSVEIGQVMVDSITAAVVTANEIFQVPGQHQEQSSYPVFDLNYATGEIAFVEALPAIHVGNVPKRVYIKGSTPLFAPLPRVSDWVPAEATYSISSTDTYDGPVGSTSSALSQASWSQILQDGITDNFLALKGQNIWTKFRQDRDQLTNYQLTQGILGVSRSFPAGGGPPTAACTLTPTEASVDIAA